MLRLTTPTDPGIAHDPNSGAIRSTTTAIQRDPYRRVVFVLLAASWLGAGTAYSGATQFGNPVLFVLSLTLALAGGVLSGVAAAQMLRAKKARMDLEPAVLEIAPKQAPPLNPILGRLLQLRRYLGVVWVRVRRWLDWLGVPRAVGMLTALAGAVYISFLLRRDFYAIPLKPVTAVIAAALCLAAAGLAATAARYLGAVEPELLPKSGALRRGARVAGWILVLAAVSIAVEWASQDRLLRALYYLVLAVDGAFCIGLFIVKPPSGETREVFALDVAILSVLGSRTNVLAGILDSAERQLGIDIRSTWALTIVRRSVEPLLIGLLFTGWLSTCLTVVAPEEQGLIERMGVPLGGEPLLPGLHVHLPWPTDRVWRPHLAQRVQLIEIGHEGQEPGGHEDVLWAIQHAANEYTPLRRQGPRPDRRGRGHPVPHPGCARVALQYPESGRRAPRRRLPGGDEGYGGPPLVRSAFGKRGGAHEPHAVGRTA